MDGDYAVVIIEDRETNPVIYYKRRDNTWERDESIPPSEEVDMAKMFCNTAEKCISMDDQCNSLDKAALDIQKLAMQQMTREFVDNLEKVLNKYKLISKKLEKIRKPDCHYLEKCRLNKL